MKNVKDYIIPILVLLAGLFLSSISAYYSVLGLISIFSGSAFLITLMGISLEYAKIACCIWLHKHWNDKIGFLKIYLSIAIIILMVITSLGVYGFLTKANLKQSESVDLNAAKVASLESNIQREQQKLDFNLKQIDQDNTQLSKLITTDVHRASNERKRIQYEISSLSKEAKEINKTIDNLNNELTPYKSKINAVEVEVGTLVYIAKLIYGTEYKLHLSQILTSLTLLIIFVFDPLAIGLLIASQKSFKLLYDKNILIKDTKDAIIVDTSNQTTSSWDNFKMTGGTESDIRKKVEELKRQVQVDMKKLNIQTEEPNNHTTQYPNYTQKNDSGIDEWIWDETPEKPKAENTEIYENRYYKSDNISDDEWIDESAEISEQQWEEIPPKLDSSGRTPKRYRQTNKGN